MAEIKNILLVNAVNKQRGLATIRTTKFKPLSLGILAGLTPPDIKVHLIDENFDVFEEKIKSIGPVDLAGITSFTSSVTRGYEIASYFKGLNIPVIMGGIHVSFCVDEALRYCDSVVSGEAEGIWEKVIEDAKTGSLKKIYKHGINPGEITIGRVDNNFFSEEYLWGAIQTSRGCPMNCDFCTVTVYNGFSYRQRPIDEVIEELKKIRQKLVFFYDDNIIGRTADQKARALEMFKRIAKENLGKIWHCQGSINVGEEPEILKWMYKAGCRMICVGFESIDEENLKKMHKGQNLKLIKQYPELIKRIHDSGIAVLGAFMIGYPFDNFGTTRKIPEFILDNSIDAFNLTHLTPFPGTLLYKRFEKEGRVIARDYPEDWKKYNFSNVVYKHENLQPDELIKIVNTIKDRLVRPAAMIIYRFLRTWKNTRSLSSAFVALTWNLGVRSAYINGIKKRVAAEKEARKKEEKI